MNLATPSPDARPARLLPDRPLPPYSYVPGRFPHPVRDAAGHSYGHREPKCSIDNADQWRACEPFLWGIDLFNTGYYWEAHESWEAVWHAAGRRGSIAEFCKGLIKLAAAGVKAREGNAAGVRRHAARAKQLFQSVISQEVDNRQDWMGLSLDTLIGMAEVLIDDPHARLDTSHQSVRIVMPNGLTVNE